MKRFLVFGGDDYYPNGGWGDLRGRFDTAEAAFARILADPTDWWEVIDMETEARVADPPGFHEQVQAAEKEAARRRAEESAAALARYNADLAAFAESARRRAAEREAAFLALVGGERVAAEIRARVTAPRGALRPNGAVECPPMADTDAEESKEIK